MSTISSNVDAFSKELFDFNISIKSFKDILADECFNPNYRNSASGETLLFSYVVTEASLSSDLDKEFSDSLFRKISLLLKHPKINVNLRASVFKTTPLHVASPRISGLLLNHPRININAKDSVGNKPQDIINIEYLKKRAQKAEFNLKTAAEKQQLFKLFSNRPRGANHE